MSPERIPVVPEVLKWARESIGLDQAAAARKLGVREATLAKWETGDLDPTITQLRNSAKHYKRPLAVLLLPEAPSDFQPLRDYRARAPTARGLSPALIGEVRRAVMQREVFLELADVAPDVLPEAVSPPGLPSDIEAAGDALRAYVGIDLDTQRHWTTQHEALNAWIGAVESRGVLVLHTRDVTTDEARGFSISEWPYPVIAINGSDWPRARIFTLLHEMVHIGLNLGGVCDLHEPRANLRSEAARRIDDVEQRCNAVAAAALLPKGALLAIPTVRDAAAGKPWTVDELGAIAGQFSVSTEALLLRLISIDRATWETYRRLKPQLEAIYADARQEARERQQEREGGPSYYLVKARNIGHSYANSVVEAHKVRAISSLDVADYLDIKYNQLPKLERVLR